MGPLLDSKTICCYVSAPVSYLLLSQGERCDVFIAPIVLLYVMQAGRKKLNFEIAYMYLRTVASFSTAYIALTPVRNMKG
jgi:hypothetical protein